MIPRIVFLFAPHFLCECEVRRSPELRGLPLVIASGRKKRSLVLDVVPDELASRIPRGTELGRLLRAAPKDSDLNIRYLDETLAKKNRELGREVERSLGSWSPVVSAPFGGAWFVDLSGTEKLFGRTIESAARMAAGIGKAWGLRLQAGLGPDPWSARLAGRWAPADTVLEVDARYPASFYDGIDLSFASLSAAGVRTLRDDFSIDTLGELFLLTARERSWILGNEGELLNAELASPFSLLHPQPRELSLKGEARLDAWTRNAALASLGALVESMAGELRKKNLEAGRFRLQIFYGDGLREFSEKSFSKPAAFERALVDGIKPVLLSFLRRRVAVQKFSLTLFRLRPPAGQIPFAGLGGDGEKEMRLAKALDRLRERFGKNAVRSRG